MRVNVDPSRLMVKPLTQVLMSIQDSPKWVIRPSSVSATGKNRSRAGDSGRLKGPNMATDSITRESRNAHSSVMHVWTARSVGRGPGRRQKKES